MANHSSLSYYPFDSYVSTIFTFANETLTNQDAFLALTPMSCNYDIAIVNQLNSSGQQKEYVAQRMIYAKFQLELYLPSLNYDLPFLVLQKDLVDFAGLLPCLVLLSFCAVTMVGIYIFADPHDSSCKVFTWDESVTSLAFSGLANLVFCQSMGTVFSIWQMDIEMENIQRC
ncbi:hypothetical protein F5146DRAFT_999114 [Armillaria mellea]|nr:hypothetical protein F5146DRAFT_999114 [Armillaria mellea]